MEYLDLNYTDSNGIDSGVLQSYSLDMAYGVDENDFSLKLNLKDHCLVDDCFVYVENTEYGGIIDDITPNMEDKTVTYHGRTWHGILENKCIEPDGDYYIVNGEAHEVLRQIIVRLGLGDLFEVSTEDSGITISNYHFTRYCYGYTGIRGMLNEFDAKLKMYFKKGKVVLYVDDILDYSQDEEFDSSQCVFSFTKAYNPINHIICMGQGDLEARYVIHLFTDEGGGVQPYSHITVPVKDSDYILTNEKQVILGYKEVVYVYDFSNVNDRENYVKLSARPSDWTDGYHNYYALNEENDGYREVEGIEQENVYNILTAKPSNWDNEYNTYFYYDVSEVEAKDRWKSVEAVEEIGHELLRAKPEYWTYAYKNYFYRTSEGFGWIYHNVETPTYTTYDVQTQKPTDWSKNYGSYYRRATNKELKKNKNVKYKKVTKVGKKKKTIPKWVSKKYYSKVTKDGKAPSFQYNKYYKETSKKSAPAFIASKYYRKVEDKIAPAFVPNVYYKKEIDHYAVMIESALEKFKESYDCDEIDIDFSALKDEEFDIDDIVGGSEQVTGLNVWQPITKKIIKIEDKRRPVITYEVGKKGGS